MSAHWCPDLLSENLCDKAWFSEERTVIHTEGIYCIWCDCIPELKPEPKHDHRGVSGKIKTASYFHAFLEYPLAQCKCDYCIEGREFM